MLALKILLAAFGAVLLYYLVRFVRAARRFKRSFDDLAEEAGHRLLEHAEQVDSTLERWHEYDEAYQEAAAKLEEEAERREQLGLPDPGSPAGGRPAPPTAGQAGRGATLGPTGGTFRKPN